MVSINPSEEPVLGLLALFALLGIYRTYRMSRGTQANPTRMIAVAVFYVFLWIISVAGDAVEFPYWFLGVEAALLVGVALATTPYVRRVAEISTHETQGTMYRLGALLPAIYLVLFLVRLSADVLLFGGIPGLTSTTTTSSSGVPTLPTLSGWQLGALAGVDALFSASAGLVVGRSAGVALAVRDQEKATPPPPPPSAAPPLPP